LRVRIGEYFSGPGGLALGAAIACRRLRGEGIDIAVEHVFAVDYHEDACATYHRNIHGAGTEATLVRASECRGGGEVPGINVRQGSRPLVLNADVSFVRPELLSGIDLFMFGFPCNDFSSIGEKKGLDGAFGRLYRHGVELLRDKKPKLFVAENVSGILSANERGAFSRIMEELRCGGDYEVVPHLYRFEEYGVPQTRHRVIVVGVRKDLSDAGVAFRPPAPGTRVTTAREALDGIFEAGDALPNNDPMRLSNDVKERLSLIPPGGNVWDSDLPVRLRIKNDKTRISTLYKVLDPDKPAYTVIGAGGGGTYQYHWDRRATTNRERAALQTFPRDYAFVGGRDSVRKQVGMAVPPAGASEILAAVFKALLGIEYPSVTANLLDRVP
jgi:DNA (cytosine-5)-methyltransferase 1